ncbi:MAG: DinB family protein [Mucilaginibacter sp.]
MKSYFTGLFNYDHHANHLILETISEADNPPKPVELMAHLLAAQQIWLSRCKGDPVVGAVLVPDWPVDTVAAIIDENHSEWINYIATLTVEDFEKEIFYKNLRGMPFQNKLADILAHVINHGTHHRAQAGQLLKIAGVESLPITDYIFYMRDK